MKLLSVLKSEGKKRVDSRITNFISFEREWEWRNCLLTHLHTSLTTVVSPSYFQWKRQQFFLLNCHLYISDQSISRGIKWREAWNGGRNECSCHVRKPRHTCLFSAFSLLFFFFTLWTTNHFSGVSDALPTLINQACQGKLSSTETKLGEVAVAHARKLSAFKPTWLHTSCQSADLPGTPKGLPGMFQSPQMCSFW